MATATTTAESNFSNVTKRSVALFWYSALKTQQEFSNLQDGAPAVFVAESEKSWYIV